MDPLTTADSCVTVFHVLMLKECITRGWVLSKDVQRTSTRSLLYAVCT